MGDSTSRIGDSAVTYSHMYNPLDTFGYSYTTKALHRSYHMDSEVG